MAKRGRPPKDPNGPKTISREVWDKLYINYNALKKDHEITLLENVRNRKMAEQAADKVRELQAQNRKLTNEHGDIKRLTEERDEMKRGFEDRFLMSQTLAKQLVEAEKRITDLLEEIRMYEHEHSTLRHIIIDALRGYDR